MSDYPQEPTFWKEFEDAVGLAYKAAKRLFPDPNDPAAYRRFSRCGFDIGNGMDPQAAFNKHIKELSDELGIMPQAPAHDTPASMVSRPFVGPLRVENKKFRDDSGYRRVLFCSWFTALRILKFNPNEFYRQLDAIVAAGYQGVRVFLAVGGWSDFWDNHEVVPVKFQKWFYTGNLLRSDKLGAVLEAWPDYDDVLRTFLRECKKRGLRVHFSVGDTQIIFGPTSQKELDFVERVAKICAEEGGAEVVALCGDTNEYPINRGDNEAALVHMGKIVAIWKKHMPNVLTTMGANCSEEVDKLNEATRFGDVCDSHTLRDPFAMCIKRTLGLVYFEGNYRGFPKAFWQGEPAGPGSDSFARQDDKGNLVALYAMHGLTGQASNWFQGAAVRSNIPLEAEWGFKEMPPIMANIPEDIVSWDHDSDHRGGIVYWWKDKNFITSSYKDWNPSPPRPIKNWTLCDGNGTKTGTGNPPPFTGLLVGEFQ